MAIAFVTGQKAAAGAGASATTIVVSFPSQTANGSLLVVHCGGVQTVQGVTDDGGNTWVKAVSSSGAPSTGSSEIWYKHNAAPATAVTVTFTVSSGFRFATVSEYSGVMTVSDPIDKTDTDNDAGTAANAITTPDSTPAVDGELIFVAGRCTGLGPGTPNSPFTLLSQAGQSDADGYFIQTTAAAIHADYDNNLDTHWVVQIATFKPPEPTIPIDTDYLLIFPTRAA